jgi:hypothetical protein
MKRRIHWALLGALFGCDDGGDPPVPDAAPRQIGQLDQAVRDAVVDARVVDAMPDMRIQDAMPDRPPMPDLGPPCMPVGDRQCRIEGGDEVFVCTAEGGFDIERCDAGLICRAGDCVDPLTGCDIGALGCLDAATPVRCDPDPDDAALGRWVADGDACAEGQVCSRGQCLSPSCAAANATRSYLGCDYWPLDMQAFRYASDGFESVNSAPLGVLVFNPDTENPVAIDVLGPDGQPGQLVDVYQMEPPTGDDLPPRNYAPRRLRSDLAAADGTILIGGIESGGGLEIPPGGRGRFLIPRTAYFEQTSHLRDLAWRIRTQAPVVAYQFNPLCCNYSFSNDASLLIPTNALGQRYRVLTTPTQGGYLGGMAIVGTAPDTEVVVRMPDKRIVADPDGAVELLDGEVRAMLQPHQTLVIQSRNGPFDPPERDLSGALIESTRPVAVFAGHQCAQYPAASAACDHLEEQLFPTQAWGRRFVLVPFATRGRRGIRQPTEVNYFKFVADTGPTRIELSRPYAELEPLHGAQSGVTDCVDLLDGPDAFVLQSGQTCEFGTLHPFQASADQPVLVRGVLSGQRSTGEQSAYGARAGDPASFLIAPDRQFRDDYPFYVPDSYARNVVTLTAFEGAQIQLDGELVDMADAEPVPGTGRVYKHIELRRGSHHLTSTRPFGILVYGYDDFVAYAFTGGLNLEKE